MEAVMSQPRNRIAATALAALAALDVTLFVLANLRTFSNAEHGTKHIVAGVLWIGFLAGSLALLVTLAIWISRTTRRRRALP
jgi:hypothetical protein